MKALKYIAFILLASIVIAPCFLIFNEQQGDEPQRWYINIIGLAYTGFCVYFLNRKYKKP